MDYRIDGKGCKDANRRNVLRDGRMGGTIKIPCNGCKIMMEVKSIKAWYCEDCKKQRFNKQRNQYIKRKNGIKG